MVDPDSRESLRGRETNSTQCSLGVTSLGRNGSGDKGGKRKEERGENEKVRKEGLRHARRCHEHACKGIKMPLAFGRKQRHDMRHTYDRSSP